MRWFYLPNEYKSGDQIGPRMAFEAMLADGTLSAYTAYSYLVERARAASQADACEALIQAARDFAPDIIFVQHINSRYPTPADFYDRLRALPSRPRLVVHEGDPYNRYRKRLPQETRRAFAAADMVVLVGLGTMAELACEAGARCIRMSPHSFDTRRFGGAWTPSRHRHFDAVMIANCPYYKNLPGLYLPGGRLRKQSAEALYAVLGERFAVHGAGGAWRGRPYLKGPVDFSLQGEVVRDAWMSVNWHHFDEIAMYSSDRLAIGLASGVPHLTNHQEGYAHLFEGIPGCFVVHSPREMRDTALYILSLSVDRRIELGLEAAAYAHAHLEATVVYRDLVSMIASNFAEQTRELS